ncbi:unnamed protein product [Kuraishia capsulata CBS 1993]|uniref:Cyclin-like domain-containing protein n=1 Tax=Kuraishia capsulata CBS 1993 TaxID=1382522 RepID=W6MG89_9ASCO|nr:uncharacterized protein KUCA_T00000996001 [Kuraishia capsulata CBS 1993]CDK25029.1 unnamed protein product [Kuraishia capsulata CBS 1993]
MSKVVFESEFLPITTVLVSLFTRVFLEEMSVNDTKPTTKRVSNDDLYRRSSQYRVWSFTSEELQRRRQDNNLNGTKVVKQRVDDLEATTPELQEVKESGVEPITVDEEAKIVAYYARKASDVAHFFKLPTQARATAISFLKKFFLMHSVMEYHPLNVMYSCIFLAAKSENSFIGIKTFTGAMPKLTPESILENEYPILESLQFTLLCQHPFRPLYGFYLDVQAVLPKADKSRLGQGYDRARKIVNESLFSDTCFLYTPPQIALAALWEVDSVVVERYLARKFGYKKKKDDGLASVKEDPSEEPTDVKEENTEEETKLDVQEEEIKAKTPEQHYNFIMTIVKKCSQHIHEALNPSLEEAKIISTKVHFCLEPKKLAKKLAKQRLTDAKTPEVSVSLEAESLKREPDSDVSLREDLKRAKID